MTSLEDQLHERWKEAMRDYQETRNPEFKRIAKDYAAAHTQEVNHRLNQNILGQRKLGAVIYARQNGYDF